MKKAIVIVCFAMLFIGTVKADLSDGFFCQVKKDEVVISLKKTEGFYNCKDTIASFESLILQAAKDLMKIQTYINRGRDTEYRIPLKDQKKSLLNTLMASRISIIKSMDAFQTNLLKKSIQYFILKVTPYKIQIQGSLLKINAIAQDSGSMTSELQGYTLLLQEQLRTIESIASVSTYSDLNTLMAKYIYLKKEILGKYE